MSFLQMLNRISSNDSVFQRSFMDQGGTTKPCSASFVNGLEKVIITNEDVDNHLCCAICQDEFKLGENVVKLPCEDPHYFHYESTKDVCGGILPWFKDHNSCPICREEFPVEESNIPVPDENFNGSVDNDEPVVDDEQVDEQVNQQIEEMLQRLFTRPTQPIPNPNQPLPLINLRNSIYIPIPQSSGSSTPVSNIPQNPIYTIYTPMIIPMNNYSEDEDMDLQEAIRQSLES